MPDPFAMMGFAEQPHASNEEVEHESYLDRLGDAISGICVGIVLFFAALRFVKHML